MLNEKRIREQLDELRARTAALRRRVDMLRARTPLERRYSADQPRVPAGSPGGGQWAGENSGGPSNRLTGPASERRDVLPVEERSKARIDAGRLAAVSKRRLAECEAQFQRDLFHCKLVALKPCYAQAIVRQVVCEKGHSIPPLNY